MYLIQHWRYYIFLWQINKCIRFPNLSWSLCFYVYRLQIYPIFIKNIKTKNETTITITTYYESFMSLITVLKLVMFYSIEHQLEILMIKNCRNITLSILCVRSWIIAHKSAILVILQHLFWYLLWAKFCREIRKVDKQKQLPIKDVFSLLL